MASFKVMSSSNSRDSDLSRRNSSSASSSPSIKSHLLRRDSNTDHSRISFANTGRNQRRISPTSISDPPPPLNDQKLEAMAAKATEKKSVDDVWREIVSGERKKMKEETQEDIMTLEDFLAKAAMDETVGTRGDSNDIDVKIPLNNGGGSGYTFDFPMQPHGYGNGLGGSGSGSGSGSGFGRGKRGRVMVEPLDKAAAQRQRRMIKNRESAARSRERKQAYQAELETLAVVEKSKPLRFLRRSQSLEW